mmetsp:Transcript_92399/g.287636  ORF Transcript_92399/g.287636 Transcript_92399/m.287636 type:complete len:85 (-) Transcript_92399:517-771(-)
MDALLLLRLAFRLHLLLCFNMTVTMPRPDLHSLALHHITQRYMQLIFSLTLNYIIQINMNYHGTRRPARPSWTAQQSLPTPQPS